MITTQSIRRQSQTTINQEEGVGSPVQKIDIKTTFNPSKALSPMIQNSRTNLTTEENKREASVYIGEDTVGSLIGDSAHASI